MGRLFKLRRRSDLLPINVVSTVNPNITPMFRQLCIIRLDSHVQTVLHLLLTYTQTCIYRPIRWFLCVQSGVAYMSYTHIHTHIVQLGDCVCRMVLLMSYTHTQTHIAQLGDFCVCRVELLMSYTHTQTYIVQLGDCMCRVGMIMCPTLKHTQKHAYIAQLGDFCVCRVGLLICPTLTQTHMSCNWATVCAEWGCLCHKLTHRRSGFGGSIPGGRWEFFSSSPRPDRLWGPPSFLSYGYGGHFPRE
jgi:hypothetical protein